MISQHVKMVLAPESQGTAATFVVIMAMTSQSNNGSPPSQNNWLES
jgi:hypothetical protein